MARGSHPTSISLASFGLIACLLGVTIEWWYHGREAGPVSTFTRTLLLEETITQGRRQQEQQQRTLAQQLDTTVARDPEKVGLNDPIFFVKKNEDKDEPSLNDDFERDDTCRKYLVNFLNGTTDAKDECQGFLNAWHAADCKDDKHVTEEKAKWYSFLNFFGLKRRRRADNGTVVDDDVVMDDYFETWQCCSSISDFYERHCQHGADLDGFKMLGIVMVLVTCGFIKSLIRVAKLQWIPDAGACIIVGAIFGGLLRLISPEVVKNKMAFDNDLFLQILLPPIIFEAALTIDKYAFRRDLFPILTLAVFGTGFSAVTIGVITYHLSSWGRGVSLPFLDSLLFGALMSSIDPVATLSILSGVGVGRSDTLYTLVFGESLLNDGVAIVLFNSLVKHMGDSSVVDRATVHDTIRDFVVVTLGSIAIGTFCGALCTLYFDALKEKHSAVTEVAMFFTWALIPYYVADGLGFSGIISIMVMGFMLDFFVIGGFQSEDSEWMEYMHLRMHQPEHRIDETRWTRMQTALSRSFLGRGHMAPESRQHVGFVAEVISSVMETAIFAYLGLFLFNDKSFNVKLVLSGLVSCVSSRAAMVIIFSFLINICVWGDLEGLLGRAWNTLCRSNSISIRIDDDTSRSDEKVYLDRRTQLILFSAGVRGAVSYALVQNIPVYDAVTKQGSKYKNDIRAMTSSTIVVLLFTFGALTYFTLQRDRTRQEGRGSLTRRLMSAEMVSDLGDEAASELTSLELNDEFRHKETLLERPTH